ncbi:hypothetical protein ATR1_262d0001, partial [Acetobacter tropicalis]
LHRLQCQLLWAEGSRKTGSSDVGSVSGSEQPAHRHPRHEAGTLFSTYPCQYGSTGT